MKVIVNQQVEPDVSTVSDEALWCRTERHQWSWQRDVMDDSGKEFSRTLVCPRCETEKVKTISLVTFTVVKSRMKYQKGYLVHGGRLAQSTIYKEQMGRFHGGSLPKPKKASA